MNLVPSHTRKAHRVNTIPRNVSLAPEDRRLGDASFSYFDAGAVYRRHTTTARRHDHTGPMMRPTGQRTLCLNQDDEASQKRELEELAEALQDMLDCLEGSQGVVEVDEKKL